MLCYTLVILFSVFIVGLTNPMKNGFSSDPERCCLPKQFSSKLSISAGAVLDGGRVLTTHGHYNFSYDQNRGLIATRGVLTVVTEGQNINIWIIENRTSSIVYTFYPDTKQCQVSSNKSPQMECLPASAQYLYSSNFGESDKQFVGDTWTFYTNDTISYATFSRNTCVPLTTTDYIQQPPTVSTSITTDFVPSIIDPNIFDVPSQCQRFI